MQTLHVEFSREFSLTAVRTRVVQFKEINVLAVISILKQLRDKHESRKPE